MMEDNKETLHKGDYVFVVGQQLGVIEDFFLIKKDQYAVISSGNNIFIQKIKKVYRAGETQVPIAQRKEFSK